MSDSSQVHERARPFVPFAERSSWGRRFFDLTVGEALSRVIGRLLLSNRTYDAGVLLERVEARLVKAGWIA
jgi:hypothetical protein